MFNLLLAGALGGLVRGIVGFLKYQFTYKDVQFKPVYISIIMLLSAVVGLIITWAAIKSGLQITASTAVNPPVAFIIGYAGGDLIENLYKILIGKTNLYPLVEKNNCP